MAQPTLPQGNTPNNNSNNSNPLNFNNTPSTTDNSVSSSGTELGELVILPPGLETLGTIIMQKLTFSTSILQQAALEITHTQKGDNNPVTGHHRTSIKMVIECKCGLDPYTFAQQHLQHLPSQDLQSAVNLLQTIFDSFLPTPEEIARQAAMKYDEDQLHPDKQKTFRGKFPKNSILSTFRVFSLSRSDVLLTSRYIN